MTYENDENEMVTFKSLEDIRGYEKDTAMKKAVEIGFVRMDKPFQVETKEGVMSGKEGDILMIGVEGELYPCDKGIFEKTYEVAPYGGIDESDGKNWSFSRALKELKAHGRVRRAGWNGKGMYVYLVHIKGFSNCLVLHTAQGHEQPGWLASQLDLLAEDWEIV
jgi:hypothetical protein